MAALAVCVAAPTVLAHHDYIRTVLWGGAIVVSAVGWGAIVARHLYGGDARVGWGLEAALGMALHLALGGLLAMLSLVSVTTSYVAVTLGVALFAVEACRRAATEAAPPGSDSGKATGTGGARVARGVVVVFFGIALFHYLGMAAERPANIIDDFQAYFSFPKQMLASGTLIEPFSSRRIFAYGGQSYLQALVLAFSTVFRIGLLDNGICVLVLAGLVVGWVRERPRFPVAVAIPALLGLLTLHYYDLNHNAGSEFSGAVFFLAMFRVLDRPRRAGESAWGNALALALVASAACTLRQSNLAAAALIPAAYYGLRMVRERDARRRWALEAALAALFSLALLLPWMVMTYRSCGTPLYPLIVGNGAQNLLSSGPNPISDAGKARYFITASLYPGRLPGLLLALTAGLLVPSRASFALRASLAGTALAIVMLFNALAIAHLIDATDRYLFPYGLAYFLAAALIVTGVVAHPRTNPRSLIAMALIVGALVLQLVQTRATLAQSYFADQVAINAALKHPHRSNPGPDEAVYAALQRSVPEHATLLVMLDQPFRLDFKRNRIISWDEPGIVSPSPHLPVGQGPNALARYLLSQGIRYVAYCAGPSPEYIPSSQIQALYRLGQGVRYVAYCDSGPSPEYPITPNRVVADLQKLTATRKQLYADNGTYVLDLATPAPR
ncbi:MAG: hypothetical protein ACLP9Y_07295 [Mycobacterium sp.]